MKKIFYIIVFLVGLISQAQTPFPTGVRLPNATKSDTLSTKTRIPIMQANSGNLINKYIPLDSISNYLTVPVINHANSHQIGGADEISGEKLAVTVTPSTTGYIPTDASLEGHLKGIDSSLVALASGTFTPATVGEINTGTDNVKGITPLGLAGSDYFTKTQNDTYYKPIGYVPAWTEITGKPTTTSYFTNNGADNTSTYVEHDEISGLVLEPPFLKELVPDTYLPSTTGNFTLRGSYFTPSMSVVVEGHTINYKTFISSNEVVVNLTTSATEGLYDVTLNNGLSVTYNDQLQVVNGTVYQPTTLEWHTVSADLDVSEGKNVYILESGATLKNAVWNKVIDHTKDFLISFKFKRTPLNTSFDRGGHGDYGLQLKRSSDNATMIAVTRDKWNTGGSESIRFGIFNLVGSSYSVPNPDNTSLISQEIIIEKIGSTWKFYYGGNASPSRTYTMTVDAYIKVSLDYHDIVDIKYIDLSDTSGGYTDYSKLISQFENDANYLQDAPSNGNEYVRKDGDWQVATGGGSGHTIQDNGVSKTARTNLNFKNFVVDDNAGNNSTDITAVVAGAPLTYDYTAVGAETSINTGVSIASNYQTEIYYGNAVLSPTIDYTLSYGATTTINFTFALEAGYPIRVVYNSSSAPNAITDTDDVPEGTTNLYADSNATNQGNTFNGANQLVKLDGTGKLPAIDGSNLTNLPGGGSVEGTAILSTGETGGTKFLREDGDGTSSWQTISGGGDMLKSENLSGLANYTTARSNLGLVIGTNVLAPNGSASALTDFPTLNQNTTGSAATLTTARTINGTSFNGSANITTTNWGTSRNLSIGGTSKAVTGGANVTWSQSEIGVNKSTIDALGINSTAVGGVTISGTPTTGQVPIATSGTTATWGAEFLEYKATLYQTGTTAPTATEIKNTLGVTLTYARTGAGEYTVTASSAIFTSGKTIIICQAGEWASGIALPLVTRPSTTVIRIAVTNGAAYADDTLRNNSFIIQVYP